ncbi:MAG TPA: dethiobiotin synthase [Burkholderiales bacterium]|nr:dethiobiotin synthase [Burkholderiales bacterium]
MTAHPSLFTSRGLFLTGTDTGVGKTLVACALLHALAGRGLRVAGMKPVAAGRETDGGFHDVEGLMAASNVPAPRELVNPCAFDPPIAPHIAAARAGVRIDLRRIRDAYAMLAGMADAIVVEGAGGFLVPLNEREDFADLARALDLPVVLVVGMRLGCLNHAALTAEAISRRGLRFAGWVANRIDPAMDAFDDNLATLRERLPARLMGVIPHLDRPGGAEAAQFLDL